MDTGSEVVSPLTKSKISGSLGLVARQCKFGKAQSFIQSRASQSSVLSSVGRSSKTSMIVKKLSSGADNMPESR